MRVLLVDTGWHTCLVTSSNAPRVFITPGAMYTFQLIADRTRLIYNNNAEDFIMLARLMLSLHRQSLELINK